MPASPAAQSPRGANAAQRALHKLGLRRDFDLVLHLPLRYEDETRVQRLADLSDGAVAQIEGTVRGVEVRRTVRAQLLATLCDDDGATCLMRFFHPHPALRALLQPGQRVRARGEVRRELDTWQMMHPQCRGAATPLPSALTPVYPSSAGLAQAYLRRAIASALQRADLHDTVPAEFVQEIGLQRLYSLRQALSSLHQPDAGADCPALARHDHPARRRLQAEELLAQQLSQLLARQQRRQLQALPCTGGAMAQWPVDGLAARLLQRLPFALTAAQQRVVEEIALDMAHTQPMHRLLQGDVGSGKTVVAALAAALCLDAGLACALMVPTEILAGQHARKLMDWLQPLGVRVISLLGGQRRAERAAALRALAEQPASLVVGTHALLQSDLPLPPLGLAIIDEQHRFGVAQRLRLREGRHDGCTPHLLMMSATPIPRTLAMTYYADLDVSTLDELPPGRSPIVTKLVHARRRDEVVQRLRQQLRTGQQAYWVCPLIEESAALDLANAQATHAFLQQALPDVEVGLLHARLPAADKQAVMQRFVAGAVPLLVSTTVIEVGVDVPNATLMVIEHAERFGLAQLHQLRGRIGRGSAASVCVLLYADDADARLSEAARLRLQAMAQTSDGFEIARRDLHIRGPGEFLGARQSGDALLRFADVQRDAQLVSWAREAAARMLREHPAMARAHVQRWLGEAAQYLDA